MTRTDWLIGAIFAGAAWGFAVLFLRQTNRQRRARDRREMRQSAARWTGAE